MPEQLDTKILPLLPLTSGVVLPGMVVTITLETDEARVAEMRPVRTTARCCFCRGSAPATRGSEPWAR
jgi:hypothetical protein